jgi:hypothetical protein
MYGELTNVQVNILTPQTNYFANPHARNSEQTEETVVGPGLQTVGWRHTASRV